MTQGPGHSESFPTKKELFGLQNKTFIWLKEHGVSFPADDQVATIGEVAVAGFGPSRRIELPEANLRRVVPDAVAALGLAGAMELLAADPWYDLEDVEGRELKSRVAVYMTPHAQDSPYIITSYHISGDNRRTVDGVIVRDQRPFEGPTGDVTKLEWAQDLFLEAKLGTALVTTSDYRALSAIVDACIEHGPELAT